MSMISMTHCIAVHTPHSSLLNLGHDSLDIKSSTWADKMRRLITVPNSATRMDLFGLNEL
jgi:hypothetical protein